MRPPRNPRCLLCPLRGSCAARKKGVQEQRPVKAARAKTEKLDMAIAVVRRGTKLLLRQRPADLPLMPGFWELPEISGKKLGADCFDGLGLTRCESLGEFRHGITFRDYRGHRSVPRPAAGQGASWVPLGYTGTTARIGLNYGHAEGFSGSRHRAYTRKITLRPKLRATGEAGVNH